LFQGHTKLAEYRSAVAIIVSILVFIVVMSPPQVLGISYTGSIEMDKQIYPVPFGAVGANQGQSDFDPTNSMTRSKPGIFPLHQDATTGGLTRIDTISNGTVIVYIRINDKDFDISGGIDKISRGINDVHHGPVAIQITRGGQSMLLAYAGGPAVKQGKILNLNGTNLPRINSAAVSNARDLGPMFETAPNSGIFQIDLPIKLTDGPSDISCPQVDNFDGSISGTGFSASQLVRFYSAPSSGKYCVMAGDTLTISYFDLVDATGNFQIVTHNATFDLRTGELKSDKSVYFVGRDMILTLNEPDFNTDSQNVDHISLDLIEWNSQAFKGTIGIHGGQPAAFNAMPFMLTETGPDTGVFQTVIKIPYKINGNLVERGEQIQLGYTDWAPAGSKIVGASSQDRQLTIYTTNFGATVELDQQTYTWTDRVYITVVAPDHNFDPNRLDSIGDSDYDLTVSTNHHKLSPYKLEETGVDTGIFTGYVILTGNSTIKGAGGVDGFGKQPTGIGPGGTGPTGGFLPAENVDGISVSFEYTKDQTVTGTALIHWNTGDVEWLDSSYPSNGQGTLQIVDPDMNLDPNTVDKFNVVVWSTTDPGGTRITMTETNLSTGIFHGTVKFSTTLPSSGNTLQVAEGDTVSARYTDRTLPLPYTASDKLNITAITLIGHSPDLFRILLKNGPFEPTAGFNTVQITSNYNSSDTVHFLLQFTKLPSPTELNTITNSGITLLDYITGNTYIASTKVSNLNTLSTLPNARWAGPFDPSYKIDADLNTTSIPPWASQGNKAVLTVQLNKDADIVKASDSINKIGGKIISVVKTIPSITILIDLGKIKDLSEKDFVQYISFVDPPLQESNDMARKATKIDSVQREYNLSGNGVTALVYDLGIADKTHPDFGDRIIENNQAPMTEHATHVTGTLGGSGYNSDGSDKNERKNKGTYRQWEGMAPEIKIRSFGLHSISNGPPLYNESGNMEAAFTTAIQNGIDLATMSLNTNVLANGYDCNLLGSYLNTPILIDKIVDGSIGDKSLLFFESVGNERQGTSPRCGQTSTISPPATAKDSLAVGAINSDDKSIYELSSFGPTKDGRLKPDIVAPGCTSNKAGIISTGPDKGYISMCGTSMASPIAAGAAALIMEQWNLIHVNGTPLPPHTVKAIMIHTATDLGAPGPDYQFGWGAVDAKSAVDLVRADKYEHLIKNDSVIQDQSNSYQIISDGKHPVKATLVWDDPSGTRLISKNLVNDLDMRLTDPNDRVYEPLVLNPNDPESIAARGNDDTNNVEMIIGDAEKGTWTLTVDGTTISDGTQPYTVITSEGADDKTMTVSMDKSSYQQGDSATITVNSGPGPVQSVELSIIYPNGTSHPVGHVTTDSTGSGSSDFDILADSPTGTYQLIANSESTESSGHSYLTFEVIPEFGSIATIVFVTAVIFTLFLTRARTVSKF